MSPADVLTAARTQALSLRVPRVAAVWLVPMLAMLSFALPSAPTYDPWAWIVWGREITQLDLLTVDGPSWKPLPVLLTTLFAPLGGLAPDLWLFAGRAGAIAGVPVTYALVRRLGGGTAGAVLAAAAYAGAPWTLRHGLLGNSEGLFVALLLGALLLHLDGRPRWAFAAGLGCALLRPEAWPFLGLYGLWRLWRGDRLLVLAGFASLPVLWLGPEWWGSGNPFRAAARAQQPNPDSPAFAANPALEILEQFARMLPPVTWAGLLAAAVLAVARRRAPGAGVERAAARSPRGGVLAATAAIAVGWFGLVAAMTSGGFAGNARYLIPAAALVVVLAGVAVGTLLRGRRTVPAVAVALLAALAPQAPAWDDELRLNRDQAALTDALPAVVAAAGGPERLTSCGAVVTGPYQVPALAWHLGIHTSQVTLRPHPPATVFRARNFPDRPAEPSLRGFDTPLTTLAVAERWRVLTTCGGAR